MSVVATSNGPEGRQRRGGSLSFQSSLTSVFFSVPVYCGCTAVRTRLMRQKGCERFFVCPHTRTACTAYERRRWQIPTNGSLVETVLFTFYAPSGKFLGLCGSVWIVLAGISPNLRFTTLTSSCRVTRCHTVYEPPFVSRVAVKSTRKATLLLQLIECSYVGWWLCHIFIFRREAEANLVSRSSAYEVLFTSIFESLVFAISRSRPWTRQRVRLLAVFWRCYETLLCW